MIRGLKEGVLLLVGAGFLANAQAAVKSELFVKGFSRPVFLTAPPGDTNRVFVVEQQTGRIRIVDMATRTIKAAPFLTVTNLTKDNEQGLLGLAFHPGYRTNGYFYINQTAPGNGAAGHTEINRFQAQGDPATTDTADPSSKKTLLSFSQPESNHNGGWMAFGKDGYLYFSQGDGGGGDDRHGTFGNGQNRSSYLGKIHRIDVDHGDPYSIPDGNPFKGNDSTYKEEIWAFGLRNPWRCSFDRETGDLWVGDVGQSAREEVDVIPAGAAGLNFGWRPREGAIQNKTWLNETPVTSASEPVYDYGRSTGVCVTGGYVYRGSAIPSLRGKYLFADYGSARFWALTPNGTNRATVEDITSQVSTAQLSIDNPASFGEDAAGELYVCSLGGSIFKFVSDAITLSAASLANNEIVFTFPAKANQAYALEAATSLGGTSSWNVVTNIPASASNKTVSLTNSVNGAERYFRLRTP